MQLTNIQNLPEAFINAVRNDPYDASMGDISVTRLIDSPYRRKLYLKNYDKLVEDVSDRVWALLGQAVHHILERGAEGSHVIKEERMVYEYGGLKVTGQLDTFNTQTGVLSDYKVTSTYKLTSANQPNDWIRQLNILAQLLRDNFWDVKKVQIVAILRDWSSTEAMRNPAYPQSMVQVLDMPLWSEEDTLAYIQERVALHKQVMEGEDIPCTDEERWMEPTSWALMKVGGKKAIKVYRSQDEVPLELNDGQYIEERKGSDRRCEKWCEVAKFCKYYQEGQK